MSTSSLEFTLEEIEPICRKYDVSSLGLFGSVVRGDATPQSDIDLLVRFLRRKSLLTLVRLERELSNVLGCKVDLVTEGAISPYLKDRILGDLKVIYEAR